jgi:uncharacterized protein
MKRTLLFFIGLISISLALPQDSKQLPKTLLWKISGNGLAKPSYLFGTMHILCADDAGISDSLENCIKNCDEIYFEINLDDLAGMISSMKFMWMNDNKKLSDLLNAADYAKVKTHFNNRASLLPFSMLERFKPLLISSLLEEEGLGCKTTNGMELVIMKEAHTQEKKIRGLETAGFQAGLFDSIPYEKQARDLVNYIDSADQYNKLTLELISVYKKQDLQKIDELTRAGDPAMNDYMDLLLYDRNRKWVDSFPSLSSGKSLLIAVGAGHLPGDKGLIALLRKKGYLVSPVKN